LCTVLDFSHTCWGIWTWNMNGILFYSIQWERVVRSSYILQIGGSMRRVDSTFLETRLNFFFASVHSNLQNLRGLEFCTYVFVWEKSVLYAVVDSLYSHKISTYFCFLCMPSRNKIGAYISQINRYNKFEKIWISGT
jgi:hypothetical protein